MNRQKRKFVFEQLFMCEFYNAEEVESQLRTLSEDDDLLREMDSAGLNEESRAELRARAAEIMSHQEDLDALINQVATGWKTHRMGRAELAIIRLALFEMKYDDEIPYRVAINEAVELAKTYGGEDSPGFVNAVLGKLADALNLTE
ncbi:MAG: transcription antitermination factor NusB [Lachnospiraceae bacterium]|nr:transcription antitermination factor NusB [Lachnospiraceae bacterium]